MEMFDQFQTISDDLEDIESNFSTIGNTEMGDEEDLVYFYPTFNHINRMWKLNFRL